MSNATAVLDEVMEAAPLPVRKDHAVFADTPLALPAWFREQQIEALRISDSLPRPTRKESAWRFANVDALDLSSFTTSSDLSDAERALVLEHSSGLTAAASRMIFADDRQLLHDALPAHLRKLGVMVLPLEQALVEHEEIVRTNFMVEPAILGSAKYAALHQGRLRTGTFVYVPRGVEVELPIEIFHWLVGENASVFPHLLLVAEEMSKVTVIEHFRSVDPTRQGFACGVNDLVVGRGATVKYVCAQDWGEEVLALQMNNTKVARDASAMSLNVNVGAAYSRFESRSRMTGEGARSDLLAVCVATGKQEFDARTLQDHESPHTTSDLLYKNSLDGRARTTFGGLIRVEPHAHFTDAYQTVRNLLLSDDCEANSMPGLEILADNVKCSHGATSGQLHEDEMFYLLARGISPKVARQLLVQGFLNEATGRLQHPALEEQARELIAAKFARQDLIAPAISRSKPGPR